uniref:Uncharacterized protein n=1 Tax=Poecilia reticulata TaxID=8081 RepID=A0A3P9NNL7_POERE
MVFFLKNYSFIYSFSFVRHKALVVLLPQRGHHHGQELLEIVGVLVCGLNVVHVLHSFLQTCHDDLPVSRHFGVCCYGRGVVEVSKAAKVPLNISPPPPFFFLIQKHEDAAKSHLDKDREHKGSMSSVQPFCSSVNFICTSWTEPEPQRTGTCPWPRGPRG